MSPNNVSRIMNPRILEKVKPSHHYYCDNRNRWIWLMIIIIGLVNVFYLILSSVLTNDNFFCALKNLCVCVSVCVDIATYHDYFAG